MNVLTGASNLAGVAANRLGRLGRHAVKRLNRLWRSGRRGLESSVHTGRRAARETGALPIRINKAATRMRKRSARFSKHVVEPWLEQRQIERELEALARGRQPIVIGPWLSEVGYEVLYWRPFLTWMMDRYGIAPDRVVAVSRGGVEEWYRGIAGRYVELLELFEPEEFAARNAARRAGGDQKQLAPGEFDAEIVARVTARHLDGRAPQVCHPSLMFRLFRRFWFGDRSLDFLLTHTRFERLTVSMAPPRGLPPRFAAVKFYTGAAVPDTPELRRVLRGLVSRVAEEMPVVVLDTGLNIDEHRDFLFEEIPNVFALGARLTPATNLAVQSQVIAGASLFLGTCGSLAWLAPIVGTPAIGVYADDRFLAPHLFVARHAYRLMGAAAFTTVDLTAIDALDLVPDLAVDRAG